MTKGPVEKLFLKLEKATSKLKFAEPVTHVYNPLTYAQEPFQQYLERYIVGPQGRTFLLGMNPGPWGMAQTGVPFGEVAAVRDWLGIHGSVSQPKAQHPARPIQGFDCRRSEVSGRRLWGLFQEHYSNSDFAQRFVVINYCPLVFMEESGRNRTPDKLPRKEREALYQVCDEALFELLEILKPCRAVGVGRFALERLEKVTQANSSTLPLQSILHPSPANPQANADWSGRVWPILGAKA